MPPTSQPEVFILIPGRTSDWSSRLMGGDPHGTGMPNSKSFDVELEKA
jgi:hypothetical protein